MSLVQAITEIEEHRRSRVVVVAASNLDLDLLPMLYDVLDARDARSRLDILLYVKGGAVDAARRIGMLLADMTEHLGAIVPDRCQSSGTIVTLAADEIVAGPCAVFSPVDPALQGPVGELTDGPSSISTEDIRRFTEMCREWFGRDDENAGGDAIAAFTNAIFPPTLTAFYRADREVEQICRDLIGRRRQSLEMATVDRIIERLMHGYQSHSFPLSGVDLAELGLPVLRDHSTESKAWRIANMLRKTIGGGLREGVEDDWFDACIATRETCQLRRTGANRMMPHWEEGSIDD
ncbi:hypothetical protein [Pelagerythrobacter sp.]|uniref:SDH family Clp fold serine proteinase n=1 Tax=Pelagerythrobacter sp. TaxID=2800702 RepID=UPI0035B44ABF